jgi:hypothetical protein
MVANLPNDYAARVERLTNLFADFDAFDALAAIWTTNAVADPETYKEWEHPGVIAAPELAASLLLRRSTREGQRPGAMLSGAVILEAQELLVELLQMKSFMLMENASKRTDSSDVFAELRATGLVHRLAVRGPSYDWQEERTVRELFDDGSVRDDVVAVCGFTAIAALKLVDGVVTALKDLDLAAAETAIHSRLIAWTSVALGTTMSFTPRELAAHTGRTVDETRAFLTMFSLPFGEAPAPGREIDIEDVRNRPLIRDDADRYLCVSLPSLLFALRGGIEGALKDHGPKAFARYESHRSKIVEQRAVAALAKALRPDCAHKGLFYEVKEDGVAKKPELDGLMRADSALLTVESKASSMRPSAKRLAPDSLRDWLKSEVSNAARQARRAGAALLDDTRPPTLTDQSGKSVAVNLSGIDHVFELVVVLEDLSAVAPSTWLLADAEILPSEPIPLLITCTSLRSFARSSNGPANSFTTFSDDGEWMTRVGHGRSMSLTISCTTFSLVYGGRIEGTGNRLRRPRRCFRTLRSLTRGSSTSAASERSLPSTTPMLQVFWTASSSLGLAADSILRLPSWTTTRRRDARSRTFSET